MKRRGNKRGRPSTRSGGPTSAWHWAAGALVAFLCVAALAIVAPRVLRKYRGSAGVDRAARGEGAEQGAGAFEGAAADSAAARRMEPARAVRADEETGERAGLPPSRDQGPEEDTTLGEPADAEGVQGEAAVEAERAETGAAREAATIAKEDTVAAALATLPPAAELVDDLRSYLIAHRARLAGAKATVKLGRGRPVRAALLSVGESGIRAREKGLEVDVTWDALGDEGVYLLSRAFAAAAPPEIHAAHLLLAIRLGRAEDGGFENGLMALWKKDAKAAGLVESARERIREAQMARRIEAADMAEEEGGKRRTRRRQKTARVEADELVGAELTKRLRAGPPYSDLPAAKLSGMLDRPHPGVKRPAFRPRVIQLFHSGLA